MNNISRVVIIKPIVQHPIYKEDCDVPIGLGSLVKYIRDKMFNLEIKIVDERLLRINNPTDWESTVKNQIMNADVVGLSACTNEFPRALQWLQYAKKYNATTVMGGIFPSANPEYVIGNYPFVDYVVLGEGEIAFTSLLQVIQNNTLERLSSIQGIAYMASGGVRNTGQGKRLLQIPSLIDIYQSRIIDPNHYLQAITKGSHLGSTLQTMATRGCPGRCIFCSLKMWQGEQVQRPVNEVIEELEYLQNNTNDLEMIYFRDDELFAKPDYTKELFQAIITAKKSGKLRPGLHFKCTARVSSITEELLDLAAEANIAMIQYGIETVNERLLHEIKGITLQQVDSILRSTLDHNIRINPAFLCGGLDGLTRDDIQSAADYIISLGQFPKNLVYFTYCAPHPINGIFPMPAGWRLRSNDLHNFSHQRPVIDSHDATVDWLIETHDEVARKTNNVHSNPQTPPDYLEWLESHEPINDYRVPVYQVKEID